MSAWVVPVALRGMQLARPPRVRLKSVCKAVLPFAIARARGGSGTHLARVYSASNCQIFMSQDGGVVPETVVVVVGPGISLQASNSQLG